MTVPSTAMGENESSSLDARPLSRQHVNSNGPRVQLHNSEVAHYNDCSFNWCGQKCLEFCQTFSSQGVLPHNWLLLFLFRPCVHWCLDFRGKRCFSVTCPALTFGVGGGHVEWQEEAQGREDQLQTYKRRFGDEEDSTTSTTNLFDFRSWRWMSRKGRRGRRPSASNLQGVPKNIP